MMNSKIFTILILLIAVNLIFGEEYQISEESPWVKPVIQETNITLPKNIQDGEYYHLFEQQALLDKNLVARYRRSIIELTNIKGVESSSQISINFDPAYEKLIIHNIQITRDGEIIDKLGSSDISVFHRETDMDALLYDGSKTFNAILKDIRVGDILEYSYTIEGLNPVFNNKFSNVYYLEWSAPVNRLFVRIINKKDTTLSFNYPDDKIEPEVIMDGDNSEYIWNTSSKNSFQWENSTPGWYNPLDRVEISEFSSWLELKKWAVKLFIQEYDETVIQNIYSSIITEDDSKEDKLFTLINWVQEEIRYLGLESGVDSHKPSSPDITIKRRFGDCKDKSYLSLVLLKLAEIKAWPVLVNTGNGKTLNERLPMTGLFNHVIIAVEINNQLLWIDPTDTYQEGGVANFYQPNYHNGLVLDDSDRIFISMDKGSTAVSGYRYECNFDLSRDIPTFDIKTIAKFDYADYQRYFYDSENMETIEDGYINYYTGMYPGIEKNNDVEFVDNKQDNTFTIIESYFIPDLWEINEETGKKSVDLYPKDIGNYIYKPKDQRREMPIELDYPVKITQKITAMFDDRQGAFSKDNFNITSDYIEFDFKSSFKDHTLTNIYYYRTLKDSVPVEDAKEYLADIDSILDKINYSYYKQFDSIKLKDEDDGIPDEVSNLISLIIFISVILVVARVFNRSKLFEKISQWTRERRIKK
ncbi:MAG: DUF3857 domain-containing protein [Deltaproteobacteria bacterium]|nr:DUF3857 domain-containing protein [Deltaproteobacteria bacterium]